MKRTMRKVVRYLALIALVLGLALVAYGAIVNQVALNTFFALLNQGGFKAFVIGILLMLSSVILLIMSFFVGRGRAPRQQAAPAAPKPAPAPEPEPAAAPQADAPLDAPFEQQ